MHLITLITLADSSLAENVPELCDCLQSSKEKTKTYFVTNRGLTQQMVCGCFETLIDD
jgi:hypothetical protein